MEYIELIIAICSAITVIVPLGIKLYSTIKALVKEKNYGKIITTIYKLVVDAEVLFTDGTDKKEYVLTKIEELCTELKVPFDREKFSSIIEELIEVTKNVNSK